MLVPTAFTFTWDGWLGEDAAGRDTERGVEGGRPPGGHTEKKEEPAPPFKEEEGDATDEGEGKAKVFDVPSLPLLARGEETLRLDMEGEGRDTHGTGDAQEGCLGEDTEREAEEEGDCAPAAAEEDRFRGELTEAEDEDDLTKSSFAASFAR